MTNGHATPSELTASSRSAVDRLWTARRKLRTRRWAGWLVLLVEIYLLATCWRSLAEQGGRWLAYFGSLAVVLGWYYGLPLGLGNLFMKVAARVQPGGDRWRIGKYSEAELRELVDQATGDLPPRMRRWKVCIADAREVAAWTWLNVFRPAATGTKTIVLTSGSLYYLERDELKAVLLHEIAHHWPAHRLGAIGGWPLADTTWHALAFWAYSLTGSAELAVVSFTLLRWTALAMAAGFAGSLTRDIEHLCDGFAAQRVGSLPVINALLKLAEDEELSEVVLVWVAREMRYDRELAVDDLVLALAEARPYGRIFHENLFRHAAEVAKVLRAGRSPTKNKGKRRRENAELKAFIDRRRTRPRRRIRWRRFDRDGAGVLTAAEVTQLCEALVAHPDHVLAASQDEFEPTTHPSCRERVLLVHQAYPVDASR